jgi:hypothetical protein
LAISSATIIRINAAPRRAYRSASARFGVFALAFMMRPIGSIIFGQVISVIIMGASAA